MAKAEIVRLWKSPLRLLGFSFADNMFQLTRTKEKFLQFAISVQKNLHDDTYKVNPTILLRNPFIPPHDQELFVLANLRRDGVYLHVTRESWWPSNLIGEALTALEKHALTWFEEWGRPEHLAKILDAAIMDEKRIIDIIEPLPGRVTTVPWLQSQPSPGIPSSYFRDAAVVHFLSGDMETAKSRTKDWINHLSPSEEAERTKALIQLSTLSRIQEDASNGPD